MNNQKHHRIDQSHEYVHTSLNKLISLKYEVSQLNVVPKMPVQTMLTGKHHSRKRGRGLDFEEVRKYVFGDDIRNIDWKVTARTKIAHTKVFTEERERPVLLVIDQSAAMFFGTKLYTKSVISAQMSAITAWKVLAVGDRIGALVFNDTDFEYVKPQRSKKNVQNILKQVDRFNNALLRPEQQQSAKSNMLNKMLFKVNQTITHDFLVIVLSDFSDFDDESMKAISTIAQHNELIMGRVLDPMESDFPIQNITLSNDSKQIELSTKAKDKLQSVANDLTSSNQAFEARIKQHRLTLVDISTEQHPSVQLRRMLLQSSTDR